MIRNKIESIMEYLDDRNNRIKVINFLGKFSVIGGSIVTLILVAAILTKH